MHRTALIALALAVACGGSSTKAEVYGATLTGANETPTAITTTATGDATFTRNGTIVTYTINYANLSGAPTASHVHVGLPGVTGPVVVPFTLPAGLAAASGTFTGTITASATDVKAGTSGGVTINAGNLDDVLAAMKSGNAYANIHTTAHPGGEIRGVVNPQ